MKITRADIYTLEECADQLEFHGEMTKGEALRVLADSFKCGTCDGSGRVVRDSDIGTDQDCPSCGGSGVDND
jgi:DnaJ-class molecular chaperone